MFKLKMKKLILISSVLFLFSCKNNQKFDRIIWKKSGGENITLDTRERMVKDLIESELLLNKTEFQITELLNGPSRIHNYEYDSIKFYAIREYYSWNIDPDKMTFLKITFNKKRESEKVETYSTK